MVTHNRRNLFKLHEAPVSRICASAFRSLARTCVRYSVRLNLRSARALLFTSPGPYTIQPEESPSLFLAAERLFCKLGILFFEVFSEFLHISGICNANLGLRLYFGSAYLRYYCNYFLPVFPAGSVRPRQTLWS